eukprot:66068-Chlamydomonas_euryale.AAC.4
MTRDGGSSGATSESSSCRPSEAAEEPTNTPAATAAGARRTAAATLAAVPRSGTTPPTTSAENQHRRARQPVLTCQLRGQQMIGPGSWLRGKLGLQTHHQMDKGKWTQSSVPCHTFILWGTGFHAMM